MSLVKDTCPVCIGAKVLFIGNQEELDDEKPGMNGKECDCPECKGEGYVLVEEEEDDEPDQS